MIALALSILVSTLLFSCFRLFPKFNVRLEEVSPNLSLHEFVL
mgnify:CR=1 FL=1